MEVIKSTVYFVTATTSKSFVRNLVARLINSHPVFSFSPCFNKKDYIFKSCEPVLCS